MIFTSIANTVSRYAGKPTTFLLAVLLIVIWAATGPFFNYSDTWQLIVNTSTTIITFLMVFLLQSSQNRESLATQAKLDEIICVVDGARNELEHIEEKTEEEIQAIRK